MKASVIVVSHLGAEHLADSLGSLERVAARDDVEVIVVDNGSAGGVGRAPQALGGRLRTVRSDRNLGFAGGVRVGVAASSGEVLVLLNDDAAVEAGFVDAHLEALAREPRAAATGGRLVSWDGERHDFVRGAVTFDGHAFQVGQGFPVSAVPPPAAGEPLPFACGGNMAIRRSDWDASGGFDDDLFAYFEDVDLGWRLWAVGRRVVAAPDAVARHRGAATSARLGDLTRGVLFERNALRTFFANADDEHRAALGPAVLATFLHRVVAFAAERPELAHRVADPFGGAPPPPTWAERWRDRWRRGGAPAAGRHLLARLLLGPRAGAPVLDDGLLLMQLRAGHGFFAGFDRVAARRAELEQRRRVTDREIVERFPRLVVPTYPGDGGWFESQGFASLMPADWPVVERRLDEILHPSMLR